ncbi:MAG TPA: NADP-dependent oxidoreductase [Anaerolineales bacterium]
MQAVRIHDYGDASALVLEDAPRPEPQSNQVLIRMKAAGVNPADSAARNGAWKQFMPMQFPWTPGLEGAGVIESVGSQVTAFQAGQEVYGFVSGGYAQYAVAAGKDIQLKPARLTMDEAGASPMGTSMAWGALIGVAKIEAGQSVLIHGAAGGIGAFATQIAHWKKANVIGVTSTGNLDFVRGLGAQEVIDYGATTFEKVVHDVDVVLDTVGGDIPRRSFGVMRRGGILVTVAARLPADAGEAHGVRVVSAMRPTFGEHHQISELLASGMLRPTIRAVFPLAEARRAQELSETRHGRGRIILQIP